MKVRIITEREFPFEDISRWVRHCISIGIPLDEDKLKNEGFCEFECDNGYTKARSRYEIVGAAAQKKEESGGTASNSGSSDIKTIR